MDKSEFNTAVDSIIFQLDTILDNKLFDRESRLTAGLTVFTKNCPICVKPGPGECSDKCSLSSNRLCLEQKTFPKEDKKYDRASIVLRVLFWEAIKKRSVWWINEIFVDLPRLHKLITYVDELTYNRYQNKLI